jgi:hypothetical protein
MYTTYINNYDKAMHVLQETTKENPQFAELVQQFQVCIPHVSKCVVMAAILCAGYLCVTDITTV